MKKVKEKVFNIDNLYMIPLLLVFYFASEGYLVARIIQAVIYTILFSVLLYAGYRFFKALYTAFSRK
ncbi:hypothetical protein ACFP65_01500 [Marinilactibacillus sp. GCM10026970]|uniref:hypothetical protein n=1 Tax=Marinilactibacillus sp. GCM10026970 TaxID=3252642 RepID=UPI0036115687